MRKIVTVSCLLSLLLLGTGLTWAQNQTPPTVEQLAVRGWTGIQTKLLAIAEDFPEDKFDYKPHPDSRSFIEEIWHVTSSAEAVAVQMSGEEPDFAKIFSNEGRPSDRAGLLAALEKASEDSAKAIEGKADSRMVGWIEHSGEQYGKLVTIYRINGLIPPTTKARLKRQEEAKKKKEMEGE